MKLLGVVMLTLSVGLSSGLLQFSQESCKDLEPDTYPATGTVVVASDPSSSSISVNVNSNISTPGLPLLVEVRSLGSPFQNVFLSTYCMSCLNPHQFLGTFSAVKDIQLYACDGNPASAATRKVNSPTEAVSLVWKAAQGNNETFFFVATVVHNDTVFWKDLKSRILSPLSSPPVESFAQNIMMQQTAPNGSTESGPGLVMPCSASTGVTHGLHLGAVGALGILLSYLA